ncbi:MAG: hypothetical protein ACD_73C00396G0004 [uncultured bacterium]|nr:MAG: hypothetical protein ACD_73C00396G0004 [uncultured bacterium]
MGSRFIKILLLTGLVMMIALPSMAKEKKDDETTSSDESAPSIIVCNDLKDKIDALAPIAEQMGKEFARVSDQMLCNAMSQQCEYYYKVTKYYEKEYRAQCEKNFELSNVMACNYEANGCPHVEEAGSPVKASKYHAGA